MQLTKLKQTYFALTALATLCLAALGSPAAKADPPTERRVHLYLRMHAGQRRDTGFTQSEDEVYTSTTVSTPAVSINGLSFGDEHVQDDKWMGPNLLWSGKVTQEPKTVFVDIIERGDKGPQNHINDTIRQIQEVDKKIGSVILSKYVQANFGIDLPASEFEKHYFSVLSTELSLINTQLDSIVSQFVATDDAIIGKFTVTMYLDKQGKFHAETAPLVSAIRNKFGGLILNGAGTIYFPVVDLHLDGSLGVNDSDPEKVGGYIYYDMPLLYDEGMPKPQLHDPPDHSDRPRIIRRGGRWVVMPPP